ncbi:MAG: hypothetical protein IBX55_07720 [Methyloprofundus sp.]|nr:hypothetical protein [Methyloprofundus sp.]
MLSFIEFRHNLIYVKHIVNYSEYDGLCNKYRK